VVQNMEEERDSTRDNIIRLPNERGTAVQSVDCSNVGTSRG
jgi:hypothetical protein